MNLSEYDSPLLTGAGKTARRDCHKTYNSVSIDKFYMEFSSKCNSFEERSQVNL
jgi:hypothetical protein